MKTLSLTILGSASGLPEANRAHASLALHDAEAIYLLDAGEGACSALLRCGLDPLRLKKIFITHTHPDHCVGIFMILQYLHMKGWKGRLDIFLPEDALPAFQPFMNQLYLVRGEINPDYRLHSLRKRHTLGSGWTMHTIPTNHLWRWRELNLPCIGTSAYALRLTCREHSLFYSGDIAEFADISSYIQKNDLLILEGAHIEVAAVIGWAIEKGLKRLVLTHVLPWAEILPPSQIRKAKRKGLTIYLAQDGMRLKF